MAKRKKLRPPPNCAHCSQPTHLMTGREVYPHRPDLYDRVLWKCAPCGAWVGCHRGGAGSRPLGTPANLELRSARTKLHTLFDPLWETAVDSGAYAPEDRKAEFIIKAAARSRCYTYLAWHMDLDVKACHIGMFTLTQCRQAWVILRGLAYPEIRLWCRDQRIAQALAAAGPACDVQTLKHIALDECEGCRTSWALFADRHVRNRECTALPVRHALQWIEDHPGEAEARRNAIASAKHLDKFITNGETNGDHA